MIIGVSILIILLVGYVFFYNQLVKLDALSNHTLNKLQKCLSQRADLNKIIVSFLKQQFSISEENFIFPSPQIKNDFEEYQKLEYLRSKNIQYLLNKFPNNLSSNPLFQQMQKEWISAEDDFQNFRHRYNAADRDYNAALHTFPASLVAKTINLKEKTFFKINSEDTK